MKFLVNELPNNCGECPYHAPAVMMTKLGIEKQINLCTIQTSLIPPTSPDQELNLLDLEKTPRENDCPCMVAREEIKEVKEVKKSSIILE